MRLVIDSNKMQSIQLEEFLNKRLTNIAVLTDYVAMEAYKGDTLVSIYKSLEIVSKFPEQVVILKNSGSASRLRGRRKSLQNRLIDKKQTDSFPEYIQTLMKAKNGNYKIEKEILEKGRAANEYFTEMLNAAHAIKPTIMGLSKEYTKQERKIVREKGTYTEDMKVKLISTVLEISGFIAKESPFVRKVPPISELPNTFFFRYALACYFLILKRNSEGGVENISPVKLRNDLIDMGIVAYATFFDGIMSNDTRLIDAFVESCVFLYCIDAEVPYMKNYA